MGSICTSRLSESEAKVVCFPQLPRSLFSGTRVATHGKHMRGLQFSISRYRQDDIGWCRITRKIRGKWKEKDSWDAWGCEARAHLKRVFPGEWFYSVLMSFLNLGYKLLRYYQFSSENIIFYQIYVLQTSMVKL